MIPQAIIIQRPNPDFQAFLNAASQVLGYTPARASDSSKKPLGDAEKFLACLAAVGDDQASTDIQHRLLCHLSYSVLVAASQHDMDYICEYCSMPFVSAPTMVPGVRVAVITGTLAQWRDSVAAGCIGTSPSTVRVCFSTILRLFESEGLRLWQEYNRKQQPGNILLLTCK